MNQQYPLSPFTRLACFVTQTDADILAQCSRHERSIINGLFMRQLVTAALVFWALAYSVGSFVDGGQKWGIAFLITMALMLFDQAIIGSDWSLKGIYAEGNDDRSGHRYVGLSLRLGASLLFAWFLAIPMELAIQESAIQEKLQDMRRADNQEYLTLLQEKDQQLSDNSKQLGQLLQHTRDNLANQEARLTQLREDRRMQQAIVTQQGLEMHYQDQGMKGRQQGRGPLWEEARLKKQAAEQAIARLDEEIVLLNREISEAKTTERELFEQQMARKAESEAQVTDYAGALRDNGLFYDVRDGLLTRYLGLEALHNDPVKGDTALMFSWAIKAIIIVLELMPVLVKSFFGQAMAYTLLLITSRKETAASIVYEHRQRLYEARHRDLVLEGDAQDPAARQDVERSGKAHLVLAN